MTVEDVTLTRNYRSHRTMSYDIFDKESEYIGIVYRFFDTKEWFWESHDGCNHSSTDFPTRKAAIDDILNFRNKRRT